MDNAHNKKSNNSGFNASKSKNRNSNMHNTNRSMSNTSRSNNKTHPYRGNRTGGAEEDKFINPYTFVPLGDKKKKYEQESGEKLTGKIVYTITTKTPLFIPDTEQVSEAKNGHKSYRFFSYPKFKDSNSSKTSAKADISDEPSNPVIPGSEIRGAIRSVYEALTNSCLSSTYMDRRLSRRSDDFFKAGILEKKGDEYTLYEAEDFLVRGAIYGDKEFAVKRYDDVYYGEGENSAGKKIDKDGIIVYFKLESSDNSDKKENKHEKKKVVSLAREKINEEYDEGYLLKGEPGPEIAKPSSSKCETCPYQKNYKSCAKHGGKHCWLAEKHCAHVLQKKEDVDEGRWKLKASKWELKREETEKNVDEILECYKKNNSETDPYKEYAKTWEKIKKQGGCIPIYYSVLDKNTVYLSPACITREIYKNTMKNLIKDFAPCDKEDKLCRGCALFGTVQEHLKKSSAIRFSDATFSKMLGVSSEPGNKSKGDTEDKPRYCKRVTLKELASPKISATEFYVKRPNIPDVQSWTYDYYVTKSEKGNKGKPQYTKVKYGQGKNRAEISGRKFYWHNNSGKDNILSNIKSNEANNRNITIKPIDESAVFEGELYFDEISERQLRELIAIMNMSSDAGQGINAEARAGAGEVAKADGKQATDRKPLYAIKLGTGKPLGLGSVCLNVKEVKVRKVDCSFDVPEICEENKTERDSMEAVFTDNAENVKNVLKVLNFNALDKADAEKISYPYVEGANTEGFKWFVNNRNKKQFKKYLQPLKPKMKKN